MPNPSQPLSKRSPFDLISRQFTVVARSRGMAIDGTLHPDLPQRTIRVAELPAMLLHPSMSPDARDAVLRIICSRARADEQWMIVLLHLLRPGLKRAIHRVGREFPELRFDIEAEMVAGVIERLESELAEPWVASRLVSAALARARRAMRLERRETTYEATDSETLPLADMQRVLDRAVEDGVLTADAAELIARTRIYGEELPAIAREMNRDSSTIRHRRMRAEARLRSHLESIEVQK